jgi:hypothetical protein
MEQMTHKNGRKNEYKRRTCEPLSYPRSQNADQSTLTGQMLGTRHIPDFYSDTLFKP